MMYAGRTLLSVALLAACVVAFPNHLKAKVDDSSDPIPKVTAVSASAGGFSAQAGIDRQDGPFASAGSPIGGASAGPGGAISSAGGAVTGIKPVQQGPTVFDNIFNIPISVLQAVNTYLNNREPIRPVKHINRRNGHHPAAPASPESDGQSVASTVAESGADAPALAPASGAHPQGPVVRKRVNFDEIFAIPISALKSVNHMLNNGK